MKTRVIIPQRQPQVNDRKSMRIHAASQSRRRKERQDQRSQLSAAKILQYFSQDDRIVHFCPFNKNAYRTAECPAASRVGREGWMRGDTRESGRRAFPVPRPDSNQMQSKSVQSALFIILSYIPLKPLSNRPSPEENVFSRARTSAAEKHGPRRLPPKHTGQHLIPHLNPFLYTWGRFRWNRPHV